MKKQIILCLTCSFIDTSSYKMVQVAELVKYCNCLKKKLVASYYPVTCVIYISIYECEIFYACHILKKIYIIHK